MNDRQLQVALTLLARQLADLPLAIVRAQREFVHFDRTEPASKTKTAAPGPTKIEGLDVDAANAANRAAAATWPRVEQLINLMASRAIAGVTGAGNLHPSKRKRRGRLGGVTGTGNLHKKQRPGNPYTSRLRKGVASAGRGAGMQLANLLKAPFAALASVLSPMAIAARTINDTLSGFQLVNASVRVFAATLAPILLPVFFAVAAGLVYLSDKIWADFGPALESFYGFVLRYALPAVQSIVDAMEWAAHAIRDVIDWMADSWVGRQLGLSDGGNTGAGDFSGQTGAGGGFDDAPGFLDRFMGASAGGGFLDRMAQKFGGQKFGDGGNALDNGGGGFAGALRDTLREFQSQMGPKASLSGLVQASRNAQLAALNQSPFEAKVLQRMQETVAALSRVVENTGRIGPAVGF